MLRTELRPVVDVYEESASLWAQERLRSPFFEKKYMDQVLAQLSPGDELLDIGCGSGFPIGDFFLKNGIQVTGIDAASSMIRIAAANFPQGCWKVADMRKLDLERKYAAIVAWDSFFHLDFTDQEAMFPIFKSHLLQDGLLVFTSGPERGTAVGDLNGMPLFHASLSPNEYRARLEENGLSVVSYHPSDKDCGEHTIWICKATGD